MFQFVSLSGPQETSGDSLRGFAVILRLSRAGLSRLGGVSLVHEEITLSNSSSYMPGPAGEAQVEAAASDPILGPTSAD